IQVNVKRDDLADDFETYRNADIGDIVAVEGTLFRTRAGELTVRARSFRVLTKSLRPLPEKWHGLADTEIRYRQRYLDLIANAEVKKAFETRTKLVRFIRNFLDDRDFVEVETPMMHSLVSGAAA